MTDIRNIPGVVVPRYASEISFQVSGRISQRLLEVGQVVKQGQVLMRLDNKDYLLARSAADAEALQAIADENRARTLGARGAISVSEIERIRVRAEAARSQQELAANRVDYSSLTAPYDGVVTAVRAEVGQVVSAGMPVVTIARRGEIEIEADVPESLATDMQAHQATGEMVGDTSESYPLRLRELSPAASQPLRTFRARFSFDKLSAETLKRLRLGMTAQVRLTKRETPATATILPATALITTTENPAVWILPENSEHLRQQPVRVLAYQTDSVSVAGLAEGDRVVIAGVQKIDEKLRVRAISRTGSGLDQAGDAE